jgi:hypothetical protein
MGWRGEQEPQGEGDSFLKYAPAKGDAVSFCGIFWGLADHFRALAGHRGTACSMQWSNPRKSIALLGGAA